MKKKIICIFLPVFGFILAYYLGYLFGNSLDNSNIILGSTKLVIEKSIEGEKNITSKEKNMPTELLGLSRDDLLEYMSKNLSYFAEEKEKIKGLMLVSFDKENVVIRKNVELIIEEELTTEKEIFNYLIKLNGDKITVYKKDSNTIFLETIIATEGLDFDSIKRLEQGIEIKNISELYRTLESFTT